MSSQNLEPTQEPVRVHVDTPQCLTCMDLRLYKHLDDTYTQRHDGEYHADGNITEWYLSATVERFLSSATICTCCTLILQAIEATEKQTVSQLLDPASFIGVYKWRSGQPVTISYDIEHCTDDPSKVSRRIGRASHVSNEMNVGIAADRCRTWLNECILQHQACTPATEQELPRRVIHIPRADSTSQGHLTPRLYETSGSTGRYAALSYCWGTGQTLITTKANFKSRTLGIDWNEFPPTFRDAIHLARDLGIEYIWIDGLCIVQDDMDDWLAEAAKMCSVYKNALLTITAAGAKGVEVGCFPHRDGETHEISSQLDLALEEKIYTRRELLDTHTLLFATDRDLCEFTAEELSSCPIITRGWIFQERLLSTRILYCGQEELIWECMGKTSCECTPEDWSNGLEVGISLASLKRELHYLHPDTRNSAGSMDPMQRWTHMVRIYSSLCFTVATDRLAAMSGIAKAFEKPENGTYYAGLWAKDLAFQMVWRRIPSTKTPELETISDARIRGPSWSWASVTEPVDFPLGIVFSRHKVTIETHEVVTELVGLDPLGAVRSGRIVASAPTVEGIVRLVPTLEEAPKALDMLVEVGDCKFRAISDVRQWEDGTEEWQRMDASHRLEDGERVLCAQLLHCLDMDRAWPHNCWLVLQKTSEGAGEWRRVGLIDTPEHRTWKPYAESQPHRDVLEQRSHTRVLTLV